MNFYEQEMRGLFAHSGIIQEPKYMNQDQIAKIREQSSPNQDPTEVCAAIRDYMVFEEETSAIYPFASTYSELSQETVSAIAQKCHGYTDTETVYAAIEETVGVNPILNHENTDGIAEMRM